MLTRPSRDNLEALPFEPAPGNVEGGGLGGMGVRAAKVFFYCPHPPFGHLPPLAQGKKKIGPGSTPR